MPCGRIHANRMPAPKRKPHNVRGAFRWIVGILRRHAVPFQVGGGFAASLYGSKRKTRDIDILIRPPSLRLILPAVRRYLVFGPDRYRDRHFDAFLATLEIYGTTIDLITECKVRDHHTGTWHLLAGLTQSVRKKVFGHWVSVEAKEKLIKIKKMIGRKKDVEDITAMREDWDLTSVI